jgi:hypothetical protein
MASRFAARAGSRRFPGAPRAASLQPRRDSQLSFSGSPVPALPEAARRFGRSGSTCAHRKLSPSEVGTLQTEEPTRAQQSGPVADRIHRPDSSVIEVQGRHGAHAFRFARAGSLLRAKVSLKSIGDLLGHRSSTSTEVYLRVATDDLRAVSLNLPGKENGCRPGRTKKKVC